jgi:glutamate 5-kinase
VRNINTFKNSKKLVIKIGSSLLTNSKGGINKSTLKNVVQDIVWLLKKNKEVVVVSSGAIALGRGKLKLKDELTLNESQAVAARGQIELMIAWKNEFKKHKLEVAQILLSPSDAENKKSSKNAIATIENLINLRCVPIINENDTTSSDEIKFGDNDILASKIAKLIKADHLILLSNVDGLYKEPPKDNKNDDLVLEVASITKTIKDMAGNASKLGKGGMVSKIKAAEICMNSKCSVIITSGLKKDPIKSLARQTTKSTRFISK